MGQKEVVINKRALHIGLSLVAVAALIEWMFGVDGIFSKSMGVVVAVVILALSYVVGVLIDHAIGDKESDK